MPLYIIIIRLRGMNMRDSSPNDPYGRQESLQPIADLRFDVEINSTI